MAETKLYHLKPGFAKHNQLMIYFVAKALRETDKAVYLYGRGTTETTRLGICCKCGRTLTHPVSVELGIGPECGGHWWNWDAIGGYTKENIERLKGKLVELTFDSWVPKSQIIEILETNEKVEVPSDHKMLKKNMESDKRAKLSQNEKGEQVIKIVFPYDLGVIDQVRTLVGRKYHKDDHCWSAPINVNSIKQLQHWGFSIDDKLQSFIVEVKEAEEAVMTADITGLKGELFPFQKRGVAFIEQKRGRALIADEMGLGKTVQALAWLQMHKEKRPAIIVVPASLKLNWRNEAYRWMENPRIQVLYGTSPWKIARDIIIINYDILDYWKEELRKLQPQVLIMDECHYFKSNSTKRTKAVKYLAKGIPHVIALSGTPIVNRPIEAYNAIRIIDPNLYPDPWFYAKRYCSARYNGFGWDFSGASCTEELHKTLKDSIMLRRLKKDVLMDLPDKIRSFVPMELNNAEEYVTAERNFLQYIASIKGRDAAIRASAAEQLAKIETLKQIAVKGKLNGVCEWIEDFLESGEKLVVFAIHKFVIDALMEKFPNITVKIDGSVGTTARQSAVDHFQNDPNIQLFVGNIQAAGVGITLTASSNVAFIELPWTPGAVVQAEDRCHRIGQKNSVNIHYLLAASTIEERIALLIDNKRKILDSVLDGKITEQESLLTELFNSYFNESNSN